MHTESALRSLQVELSRNLTARAVCHVADPRLDTLRDRALRLHTAVDYLRGRVQRYCDHEWCTHSKVWLQCHLCGAWETIEHD